MRIFLEHRQVVGGIGFVIMMFFSSIAFTVLEKAMSVIFFHRVRIHRRHFMISAIIPYVYILFLAVGALLVSFIAGSVGALEYKILTVFGWNFNLEGSTSAGLYVMGIMGLVLMLTSLYMVMPVGRITFQHALLGGITAIILWEISSHILIWHYSTFSLVNVIYGSLAASVVVLLSIEVASLILLLGAPVIAEFERTSMATDDDGESGVKTQSFMT